MTATPRRLAAIAAAALVALPASARPPAPPADVAARIAQDHQRNLKFRRESASRAAAEPPYLAVAAEASVRHAEADAAPTAAERARLLQSAVTLRRAAEALLKPDAAKGAGGELAQATAERADAEFEFERAKVAATVREPEPGTTERQILDARRESIALLRMQHRDLSDRVAVGLCRRQWLLGVEAELRMAEAELAPSPSEKLVLVGRAAEALREAVVLNQESLHPGGSNCFPARTAEQLESFQARVTATILRRTQVEVELARLKTGKTGVGISVRGVSQ